MWIYIFNLFYEERQEENISVFLGEYIFLCADAFDALDKMGHEEKEYKSRRL